MNISQVNNSNPTIAAIATPVGVGGIGIVRLSGPSALEVSDRIFVAASGQSVLGFATHTVHFGRIRNEKGAILDEVLVTVMRTPHSYTGEDVVEISGHGGPVVLKTILDLVIRNGARLAEPGEFTRRAFLNGRLDLVQAEAVLDIIQAKTESSLRVSTQQLEGDLSRELAAIREEAMGLYTQLEAIVNFPEEDVETLDSKTFLKSLNAVRQRLAGLLATGDEGRIIKEGIRVVLCGRPNVGKSSLLNVLLRQPRAIVSSIAGTTRDTIEETAQVEGVALQLVDTAGMLTTPRDEIEEEAVRRSRMFIENADLVLFLLDASQSLSGEDEQIRSLIASRPALIVLNKSDLTLSAEIPGTLRRARDEGVLLPRPAALAAKRRGGRGGNQEPRPCGFQPRGRGVPQSKLSDGDAREFMPGKKTIRVSALKRTGIDELKAAILQEVLHGRPIDTHRMLITNARHMESLRECEQSLLRAGGCLKKRMSPEFISEEIKSAVLALDRITGRNIDADLLDQIFEKFCIGK